SVSTREQQGTTRPSSWSMCYLLQSSELLLSTRRLRQEKKPIETAIGPSRLVGGSYPPFGCGRLRVCASAIGIRTSNRTFLRSSRIKLIKFLLLSDTEYCYKSCPSPFKH